MQGRLTSNILISNMTMLMLLLILATSSAQAFGCDEPYLRPYHISRSKICAVGEYVVDSYSPKSKIRCEEMEVDHLVSLRQAWESGVCGEDLKKFANDPLNLRPTYWKTNRSKGKMSPLLFSERLDGQAAKAVHRDALIVMRKYGIMSRRELFEKKYKEQIFRMSTITLPAANLSKISGRYTLKKVGQKTLILAGKRVVGTLTVVGSAYAAVEISGWSYRHLFIPDRDDATKDRAAMFRDILDDFE